jgi:RNA polymerase sigma factor (sigma-70 family)
MIAGVRISGRSRDLYGVDDLIFEALYLDVAPRLRVYAVGKGLPLDEAEAVTQEAFTRLLHARGPIRHPTRYLFRVARNLIATYWRVEERFDRGATLPERARHPRYDRNVALDRFLAKLSPRQLSIVTMRTDGCRMKEIAGSIGCSVSWTEKLLRRVREAAAEEIDLSNRRRVGRRVRRQDNYVPSPDPSLPGASSNCASSRAVFSSATLVSGDTLSFFRV